MLQQVAFQLNFFVVLYNTGIILSFLLWINQHKFSLKKIVIQGNIRYWFIFSFIWFVCSVIANLYLLPTDVDEAIISGTKAFVLNGSNPYAENVVIHLLNDSTVLGLYHYFPSDLLIYSLMYILFGFLDSLAPFLINSWYLIGNSLFLIIGYLFTQKTIGVSHQRLFPIYVFVTSFFLFSNSSLLVLYFTIGFYLLKKVERQTEGILFYILAAGVKYITGLLLFVQLLEEILKTKKIADLKLFIPYVLATLVFLVTIIPFGVSNVLNATFLYQLEINKRSQVAGIYGPILIEFTLFFNLLEYFSIMFLVSAVLSTVIAFHYGKSTYEKTMILSFLFMLILPFYATELTVVPLLLWLYSLFGVELNFPETSVHWKTTLFNNKRL